MGERRRRVDKRPKNLVRGTGGYAEQNQSHVTWGKAGVKAASRDSQEELVHSAHRTIRD